MISLRAFSRALPRAISRSTTRYSSSLSRPAFRAPLQMNAVRIPRYTAAAFSTSARRCDDIATELGAKLANELELEKENTEASADSEANVKSFLEQNDFWTLNSSEGEQDVTLTRKYDDEDITVAFSIADFNSPAMMEDEADEAFLDEEEDLESKGGAINQKGGASNFKTAPEDSIAQSDREVSEEQDEDYDSQQAFPTNVTVLIQRAGKGALRAHLVADSGRWTISAVTHLPPEASSQSTEALLREIPDKLYAGPPFAQLDEEVQNLLEQYFEARGIDTALALFLPDYVDVKEQREYQGWLEKVKTFVE